MNDQENYFFCDGYSSCDALIMLSNKFQVKKQIVSLQEFGTRQD